MDRKKYVGVLTPTEHLFRLWKIDNKDKYKDEDVIRISCHRDVHGAVFSELIDGPRSYDVDGEVYYNALNRVIANDTISDKDQ